MLYLYNCEASENEKIMVRVLGSLVTEQQYLSNGVMLQKETYTWDIVNGRINKCYGPTGSTIVVPPEIGKRFDIKCIATRAFADIQPKLVVLLGTGRVTLEPEAFAEVGLVKAHSWLKRSELSDNIRTLGRVLEDVRS